MRVDELSREQLIELKQSYYCEKNKNVSYGELAQIDELVSDEEIFDYYAGTEFVNDDFSCSCEIETKCPLCGSEMTHKQIEDTYIWSCNECPNVMFEFYEQRDLINLDKYLNRR